jgi:hypothetical protein
MVMVLDLLNWSSPFRSRVEVQVVSMSLALKCLLPEVCLLVVVVLVAVVPVVVMLLPVPLLWLLIELALVLSCEFEFL